MKRKKLTDILKNWSLQTYLETHPSPYSFYSQVPLGGWTVARSCKLALSLDLPIPMKTTMHLHAISNQFLCIGHYKMFYLCRPQIMSTSNMTYVRKNLVSQRKSSLLSQDEKERKVKSLSRVQLFATPWSVTYQASLSMGFSRQEH